MWEGAVAADQGSAASLEQQVGVLVREGLHLQLCGIDVGDLDGGARHDDDLQLRGRLQATPSQEVSKTCQPAFA